LRVEDDVVKRKPSPERIVLARSGEVSYSKSNDDIIDSERGDNVQEMKGKCIFGAHISTQRYRRESTFSHMGMDVREKDEGAIFFFALVVAGEGCERFMRRKSSLVMGLASVDRLLAALPLLAPAEEVMRGEPVVLWLGVSLGLAAAEESPFTLPPLEEALDVPGVVLGVILGVARGEPFVCGPVAVGRDRPAADADEMRLAEAPPVAVAGFLLLCSEARCSSLRNVSGLDDKESSEGMEAKLRPRPCASLLLLGVSGGVAAEERDEEATEYVWNEAADDLRPGVVLVPPVVGRGNVDPPLGAVLGLAFAIAFDCLLALCGREDEPPSASERLRKAKNCWMPAILPLLRLLRRAKNWPSMS